MISAKQIRTVIINYYYYLLLLLSWRTHYVMITFLFPLPPVQAVEDVQGPDPLEVRQLSLQLQHPGPQPLSVLGGLPGLSCLHMTHDTWHMTHDTWYVSNMSGSSAHQGQAVLQRGQGSRVGEPVPSLKNRKMWIMITMYLSYLSVNCRYVYRLYLKWSFIDFLNIFTVWVNKIWICLHKSCTDCKCQKEKSCETEMLLWHERFNSLALSQSSWYYKVLLSFSLTLYCPPLEHKNIHIHLIVQIY